MKIIVALLAAAFVLLIGFVFSSLNSQVITGDFFFFEASRPLAEYLFLAFFSGVLISTLCLSLLIWRLKAKLKAMTKQSQTQAIEISNLRKLPVEDSLSYD